MKTRSGTNSGSFDPKAVARARKLLAQESEALPRLVEFYKLLANPARLKVLRVLSQAEKMCVGDLAQVLGLSIAATSHQLKMLKEGRWLAAEGDGKMVYYSLINDGLKVALEGDLRLLKKSPR